MKKRHVRHDGDRHHEEETLDTEIDTMKRRHIIRHEGDRHHKEETC